MSSLSQTDKIFFDRPEWDLDQVQRVVQDVLTGADDGELFLEYAQSEGMSWDDGKLRAASYHSGQGFGLRVVCDETVGFAHADKLDAATLRRAASSVAAVKGGYAGTLDVAPPLTNRLVYDDLNPLQGKSFEARAALLAEIDAYLRDKDPRVHQVSVSLGASWQAVQIIKAGGWRVADIRPIVSLRMNVATRVGDRVEEGSGGGGGRVAYDNYFNPEVWQAFADEALRKSLVNQEAIDARAGEMDVVLGNAWAAVLLHEAIGHGLEGDFNRKKTSAFTELMGQRVAAQGVTIVDDGTMESRRGSLSIDDEGTPTQCTTLIEDGVLVGLMQDRMNARLMGTKSTGNGRRESYGCQPYPRMTNTVMRAGTHKRDELLANVKDGLYAVGFEGGQVDITSGKFVFSTSEAYEIKNGKVGRPVKGAALVGTGFEVLKHIKMVGDDCAMDKGVGMCGKNGQSVPVGIGQPSMLLEKMTVGGSAVE